MSVYDELKYLLERQLDQRLSAAERARFLELLSTEEHRAVMDQLIGEILLQRRQYGDSGMDKEQLFDTVISEAANRVAQTATPEIPSLSDRYNVRRLSFAAAAAVLLLLALGTWRILRKPPQENGQIAVQPAPKVKSTPLHSDNHVLLTLADGSQVPLDSMKDGVLAAGQKAPQGVKIIKNGQGEITYQAGGAIASGGTVPSGDVIGSGSAGQSTGAMSYNTISTPRGGQYHIVLPDGTQVWLNAASSLTFPLAFTGRDRVVKLTGEGYFEVAKDVSKPFAVTVNKMTVNVLGTHFNIMAYEDENAVKTTLLEGSVKLVSHTAGLLLKPGQQGSLSANSDDFRVTAPNMEEVIAWKNGEFRFENTQVTTIMRQIARWYDLAVSYEGSTADLVLSGVISRKEDVSQLLDILEATHKVHFKVEGSRVVVMPYDRK